MNKYINNLFYRSGPKLAQFEAGDVQKTLSGNLISFECGRRELVDGLKASLDKRFEDISVGVIRASEIVNFKTWPTQADNAGEDFIII